MPIKTVFIGNKCILYLRSDEQLWDSKEKFLASDFFKELITRYIAQLAENEDDELLQIFDGKISDKKIEQLINVFQLLSIFCMKQVKTTCPGLVGFLKYPEILNDFVEGFYNFWRKFERFLVCNGKNISAPKVASSSSFKKMLDGFNDTFRESYRDIQAHITGHYPTGYRQVCAGVQIGVKTSQINWPCPEEYKFLASIPMMREPVMYPTIVFDPPMNKRTGQFQKVERNPLRNWNDFSSNGLVGYPAKVGDLSVYIFFPEMFMELGFSLENLFELVDYEEIITKQPDAIYVYGTPPKLLKEYDLPTVFFDDEKNNILVGAVPASPEFGYFGYLKKMDLTLHNIIKMKRGILPFHGALVQIPRKKRKRPLNALIIGKTGAGKSETLEALRSFGIIQKIIADDMGSLQIVDNKILGYGTEIGAFVRLDDLKPGYIFEDQIDRAIIMNPSKVNSRALIPITTLAKINKGVPVDIILYANNYENIDKEHPIIENFHSTSQALKIFNQGRSLPKGTTDDQEVNDVYFANPFGAVQYRDLHEKLAKQFFEQAFENKIFVGQIRTRLGLKGMESKGPEEAAKALLELISKQ
ncbi:phosphoenolpyruvate carboxykinase [Patescibacteria group bacterium]